jgi:hypothetical protein
MLSAFGRFANGSPLVRDEFLAAACAGLQAHSACPGARESAEVTGVATGRAGEAGGRSIVPWARQTADLAPPADACVRGPPFVALLAV